MYTLNEISSPQDFFKLQEELATVTSTQSKGWHDYKLSQGRKVRYFANHKVNPSIAVWGFLVKLPVLRKNLFIVQGMAHAPGLKSSTIKQFFSELGAHEDFAGVELDSNTQYDTTFEIGLRRAGFLRTLGKYNCPLTIDIDLTQDFNFDTNWRRNIKKSQQYDLHFEEKTVCAKADIEAIVTMYKEMAKLKAVGIGLRSHEVKALVEAPDIRVFFVNDTHDEPLCARIIHCHGKKATDMFAANAASSRNCGATYVMVQEILQTLKTEGYTTFDYGRIGPSTHSADSVYTFKKASRGEEVQYLGEFSRYKNKFIEYLVAAYKLKYRLPRY
jgi:lipid II:glycine glycyltransferase (peptidoglycan interpeptide bridge formation enzyme)